MGGNHQRPCGSRRRSGVLRLGGAVAVLVVFVGAAPPAAAEAQPRERAAAGIERPDVTVVAHRGASGHAPENTLAAIDRAAALEADMVEFDVQRTRDAELVLMHDATLERTTDVAEVFGDRAEDPVGSFTLRELRRLDAGAWFDEAYAGERIPTLRQGLDRVRAHGLGLVLEIKEPDRHEGIEDDIAQVVRDQPWWLVPAGPGEPHRLVIHSFDWEVVERSRQQLPWVPHGLIGAPDEAELERHAGWADQVATNQSHIDAAYLRAVRRHGMDTYAYTANTPEDIGARLDDGVDGIVSDFPDRVLGEIAARRR